MSEIGHAVFRFEDFILDPATRELRRGLEPVALEPQVFDLLVYVIRNRERVVSKDDLVEAVWGGRIVSDSTLTTRINAMRKALGDSGEEQRLIRTVARKGIRFVGTVTEGESADVTPPELFSDRPALPLPDKPSIAVLPFQNMSGDPEQEYFADGMVEEIITALSRFHWLFVIARNSSFTYKGRAVDVKQVARELGVRYVLEGSVRKAGQKVRITGQLIDATNGAHLWADRFDGDLADVFDLQDKVAVGVVTAIEPKLRAAEIERAQRKPTASLDAYDLYLRALSLSLSPSKENFAASLALLYRAIEAYPGYAVAHSLAAILICTRAANGWSPERDADPAKATRLARAAIDFGRDDSDALYRAGLALVFYNAGSELGVNMIDRSLAMNANCANAWMMSGQARVYIGDNDLALEHLGRARRLSPLDPMSYLTLMVMAFAHMTEGRFEESVVLGLQSLKERDSVSTHRALAASYAHLGRMEEAKVAVEHVLRLDPAFSLQKRILRGFAMYLSPKVGIYIEGLRKAGIPE